MYQKLSLRLWAYLAWQSELTRLTPNSIRLVPTKATKIANQTTYKENSHVNDPFWIKLYL